MTQDNEKLLEQLKSVLQIKLTGININQKFQEKYKINIYNPGFQGVNRLFVLSFENEAQRIGYKRYYLPTVKIKKN